MSAWRGAYGGKACHTSTPPSCRLALFAIPGMAKGAMRLRSLMSSRRFSKVLHAQLLQGFLPVNWWEDLGKSVGYPAGWCGSSATQGRPLYPTSHLWMLCSHDEHGCNGEA